jgi:hypothetical protein
MQQVELRPALTKLALSSAGRSALDPLTSSDLLLTLGDIMQSFRGDGLSCVLLSSSCRTSTSGFIVTSDSLLGIGNLRDS